MGKMETATIIPFIPKLATFIFKEEIKVFKKIDKWAEAKEYLPYVQNV